jgi:uncharacterized protein (DUF1330 family)
MAVIDREELKKMMESTSDEPFVMLNLLKFKEGGGASYFQYTKEAAPYVKEAGAEVLYFGKMNELLTGTEDWDVVMMVKYPSRKAFLKMINDPGYIKAHEHRDKAIVRAVLYASDQASFQDIL